MLCVDHLSKTYNKGTVAVKALSDISFQLPSAGLVFIVGKSGSGKTTLLNLLGGIDSPTSGDIIVNGKSSKEFKENDLDTYRNNDVGFVFQEFNLLENYTVGSNIALALELQGRKVSREQVDNVLRQVELTDADGNTLYGRKIMELSGGQKQRVAIARALIKEPQIILADEPTGALDSETGASLFKIIKELSRSKLIVVVSHDRESAEKYADRIIELKDGKIFTDRIFQEDITIKTSERNHLIKGRLPFKRVLSMAAAGFKKNTARLLLSVFLAVISLTMFVVTVSAMNVDVITSELKTAYDNGAKTVTLNAYAESKETVEYSNGVSFDREDSYSYSFSQEQLNILNSTTRIFPVIETLSDFHGDEYLNKGELSINERLNPYNYFSMEFISRYIALDPETGADDACLTPVTENSRLPKTADEIAITDYHADMFMRFGYKDIDREGAGAKAEAINSPEDLIGKTIYGLTIVGIYSTEEKLAWLKQYDEDFDGIYFDNYSDNFYIDVDDYFYNWTKGEHMIKSAFVYNKNLQENTYTKIVYRLTGTISTDRRIMKEISFSDTFIEDNGTMVYYVNQYKTATVTTAYSGFTEAAWMFTTEMFLTVALILSLVIAIFSAMLLMNFLLITTERRKHEIGILRALGARRGDTVKICFIESTIIGIVEFVIAIELGALVCFIINDSFRFFLFGLNALSILYLFILCFGTIALATILPTLKIARKKPIDIINGY